MPILGRDKLEQYEEYLATELTRRTSLGNYNADADTIRMLVQIVHDVVRARLQKK